MKTYVEIIRALREDNDLTQEFVANVLGTTQQVYYRYEKGINEIPVRHIITLCKFYQVSADYMLGLSSQRDVSSQPVKQTRKNR
ncbi:helix-turn-helix domain-containing protein [Candidatus Soleaferrea massiliensis]|uniref:helix-turn-helix domain-containing protein n=1 Tax=Candidatus Soleaferrea massiliensis TaxID=1470354 RepID=UPI00058EC9C5|nr:helix-turn-helix transcriptional regulator [Candidatus Soleaferrea massiliensis]